MNSTSSAVVPRLILLAVRVTRNSLQNSGMSFSFHSLIHSFIHSFIHYQDRLKVISCIGPQAGFCKSGFWQHIHLITVDMRQHRVKLILSLVESMYRVQQKYPKILQNSCEQNRWCGIFVLERSSSETQSISVVMERWSVEHRAFAVETYFKNNDSVLTQRIFCRHLNIHRNKCPQSQYFFL